MVSFIYEFISFMLLKRYIELTLIKTFPFNNHLSHVFTVRFQHGVVNILKRDFLSSFNEFEFSVYSNLDENIGVVIHTFFSYGYH